MDKMHSKIMSYKLYDIYLDKANALNKSRFSPSDFKALQSKHNDKKQAVHLIIQALIKLKHLYNEKPITLDAHNKHNIEYNQYKNQYQVNKNILDNLLK